MAPLFTVDLEFPEHAISKPETWPTTNAVAAAMARFLSAKLMFYRIKAIFYVLGHIAQHDPKLIESIQSDGHRLGSHGFWHRHGEREGDASDFATRQLLPECVGYRSPFWDTTPRPGKSGGVWFRVLPYHALLKEIQKTGIFYVHPHDLYDTKQGPLRRRMFFYDPWERLDALMNEVQWDEPRS